MFENMIEVSLTYSFLFKFQKDVFGNEEAF